MQQPDIRSMVFKRKFAVNLYKNLRVKLAEMSMTSDFVQSDRGNMYPVIFCAGDFCETVSDEKYHFCGDELGMVRRLLGQYTPYSTVSVKVESLKGRCGVCYTMPQGVISVLMEEARGRLSFVMRMEGKETRFDSELVPAAGMEFVLTTRKGAFDVYVKLQRGLEYVTSFRSEQFVEVMKESVFGNTTVSLEVSGEVVVSSVSSYIDCGIRQADIRPIRFEDGTVMVDNGKIYLTISCRQEEGCYQGIVSWIPGTCDFQLTGVLFFDAGDGYWENDVASSIIYNRATAEWYLWMCSFSHGHVLGHASAKGELRFGVNVLDVTLMPRMSGEASDDMFLGKQGDEDPDFYYNKIEQCWYMTICRLVEEAGKSRYAYFLFRSAQPFEGYEYVSRGIGREETGGSIVEIGGKKHFICGSDFQKRAVYHIYDLPEFSDMTLMKCDYDDGGFRGWGTVVVCPQASRMRYYWLTFDRNRGSDWNWSYGNLYCYEAI